MSDSPLIWLLLLQLIFISLNAILAYAEIAVITMNDNKLAKLAAAGDKRALRLTKLTEQPAGFHATIQVGITLVNLLSSAVATENFSDRLVEWFANIGVNIPASIINILSVAIITVVLTYFTVLLGELIPKRLAMRANCAWYVRPYLHSFEDIHSGCLAFHCIHQRPFAAIGC